MKTWRVVGALLLGAASLNGCAASPLQGAQVRVHTTTAAFEHHAPAQTSFAQRSRKPGHKESPTAHACKAGNSKACNEIGDRLVIKHAYAEARQWYATACDRVRNAMQPSAERLMQIGHDLSQTGSNAPNPARMAELKSDASELRARIQGCFDTGEMVKADGELKQSLAYYDVACEFSTLVEAVGESVPGLQLVTDNGCAASQGTRAKLNNNTQFTPRLFAGLTEQRKAAAAKQSAPQSEDSMVFSGEEL